MKERGEGGEEKKKGGTGCLSCGHVSCTTDSHEEEEGGGREKISKSFWVLSLLVFFREGEGKRKRGGKENSIEFSLDKEGKKKKSASL